jgi:hypothetical protein
MKTSEAATLLYTTYSAEVGGKAFNGDPLPDWQTFSNDPTKTKQAQAWERAAGALLVAITLEEVPGQFHVMDVLSQADMLCNQIEKLPASEQQTDLSIAAAKVRQQISDLIS